MKNRLSSSLFAVLLLCTSLHIAAQEQDFRLRTGVDLSGAISSDFTWDAGVEQRFENNASALDRTIIQGQLNYQLTDFLAADVGYRTAYVYNKSENNEIKQRLHASLVLKHKIDRVKLQYKSRLQYGFQDFTTYFGDNALLTRQRLAITYIPFGIALRPHASTELFIPLNEPAHQGLSGIRYQIGAKYAFTHHMGCDVSFMIDKELNEANPVTDNILSCSVYYTF